MTPTKIANINNRNLIALKGIYKERIYIMFITKGSE